MTADAGNAEAGAAETAEGHTAAADTVSLRFTLLDMQVVDADQRPIGRVDDLELEMVQPGGQARIVHLLIGQEALGRRIGGLLGGWMSASAARLRGADAPEGPARIPITAVSAVTPLVSIDRPLAALAGVAPLERWLARHLVQPVPGAGDAGE